MKIILATRRLLPATPQILPGRHQLIQSVTMLHFNIHDLLGAVLTVEIITTQAENVTANNHVRIQIFAYK